MQLKYLCLLLVFATGCATSGGQKQTENKADLLFEAAHAAYRDKDAPSALNYLQQAEEVRADWPELHHLRGLVLNSQKQKESAEASVRRALELRPGYSDARYTLGRILLDTGRTQQGLQELTKAGEDLLYKDSFKPNTMLGIHHYRAGDHVTAEKFLTKATTASPLRSCHAYYYLGHIAAAAKDHRKAAGLYERATQKICASFGEAHYAVALMRERSKDFDGARKKYVQITEHFSKSQVASRAVNRLQKLP